VVRPRLLAGRKLVERAAEQLAAAEARADRDPPVPEAVAVVLRVPLGIADEVEDVQP
jgi:hypothetical protein